MIAAHAIIVGEMPAAAVAVIAEFHAKPGREDELRALTLPLVARARSESATLLFYLHENREAPGRFVFYEVYASQAGFEAHVAQDHVQAWFAKLPELTESGVRAWHTAFIDPR
jgi:quinol monooxygenase YgiN